MFVGGITFTSGGNSKTLLALPRTRYLPVPMNLQKSAEEIVNNFPRIEAQTKGFNYTPSTIKQLQKEIKKIDKKIARTFNPLTDTEKALLQRKKAKTEKKLIELQRQQEQTPVLEEVYA